MKLKVSLVFGLMAFGCGSPFSASSQREAWNPANDPLRLGQGYVRDFNKLPLQATASKLPWSDSYWPSHVGGIANRWRVPESDAFHYETNALEKLQKMSLRELSELSPAEKFDIVSGRFDYPLVSRERRRTSPLDEGWEGICHGWAPAAINFDEPHSVLIETSSGVKVPFAAADVKGLLSYYQGEISHAPFHSMGQRCEIDLGEHPEERRNPECRDVNAGAFHIVLVNQIALRNLGFVADVSAGVQVWNQPVFAYEIKVGDSQAPSPGAASGTVKEVNIETKMTYGSELAQQWQSLGNDQITSSASYRYRLELDSRGEIIGGEWISSERPDFLWIEEKPRFTGEFKYLAIIYEKSLSSPGIADPSEE